jgi:hypothetical protein
MQLLKRTRRRGLTIVEMLVACALAVFLMAVLSEAFVVGLKAFRLTKAMADMDQQLRQVSTLLRKELGANHFEGDARLREVVPGQVNQGYFQIIEGAYANAGRAGFPESGDAYSVSINGGPFQLGSTRDVDDALLFTVRLNGNRSENFFYGSVPVGSPLDFGASAGYSTSRWDSAAGTYASQWAEVVYFLRPDPMGLTTEAPDGLVDGSGNQLQRMPLFQLFRRQRLLVPDNFAKGTITDTTSASGYTLQVSPTTNINHAQYDVAQYRIAPPPNDLWRFASPEDIQYPVGLKQIAPGNPPSYQWDFGRRFQPITNPQNPPAYPAPGSIPQLVGFPRLGYAGDIPGVPPAGFAQREGADLLLNNVVSFDIKVWDPYALYNPNTGTAQGAFVDLGFGTPPGPGNNNWTPTPQIPGQGVYRPLGRPPVQLAYPTAGANSPHQSQLIYSNAYVYDTWTRRIGGGDTNHPTGWNFKATTTAGGVTTWSQQEPYPTSIQAIQIKIRVWDRKTNQTREVTIVQDM